MQNKEPSVKIRYTSKEKGKYNKFEILKDGKEKELKEYDPQPVGDVEDTNGVNTYQFALPFPTGNEHYSLSIKEEKNYYRACKIIVPSGNDLKYELELGNGNINIGHGALNKNYEYSIAPGEKNGKRQNKQWKLILRNPTHTGGDDPVEIKVDETGKQYFKYLLYMLDRTMHNCMPLKKFLREINNKEKKERGVYGTQKRKQKIRKCIIDQARRLFEQVYVHLPIKKAMHVAKPIQRIRLLELHALEMDKQKRELVMSDRDFHNNMTSIFTECRDLHTQYFLPSPYKNKIAFLPFLIEEFYNPEKEEEKEEKEIIRRYMVSKIFKNATMKNEEFEEGVIITHWNGMPIEDAVARNGELNAGSNKYARHARGLEQMTIRPLKTSLPPNEHWIDVTFVQKDKPIPDDPDSEDLENATFKWCVAEEPERKSGGIESGEETIQAVMGVDIETEMVLRTKKALFENSGKNKKTSPENSDWEWEDIEENNVFKFSILTEKTGPERIGYFRIYSFNVNSPNYFVRKFTSTIKHKLEEKGVEKLIVDVRGNGGGLITAAENLLEVFTRKKPDTVPGITAKRLQEGQIEPENFQFINTPLMLQLCQNDEWIDEKKMKSRIGIKKWEKSIELSIETGAVYSQGFPLLNDIEKKPLEENKKYTGSVILITDALCYSATDIFAAGFKDNKIGKILGVHKKTGAGGANVWDYRLLHEILYGELSNLPHPDFKGCDWNFNVAIRRSVRVGDKAGIPLEELGVEPDCFHLMTRKDLLGKNTDLITKAAKILSTPDICRNGGYESGRMEIELMEYSLSD